MKKFVKSLPNAFRGVKEAFSKEPNFRIMVFLLLASFLVIYFYDVGIVGTIAILMSGVLMLAVELINSAMESFADFMIKHHDDNIKYVKDVMAGASLLVSFLWLVVLFLVIFYV